MWVAYATRLGIPVHLESTSVSRALGGLADIDVVGVIAWTVPMPGLLVPWLEGTSRERRMIGS